MARKDHPPSPHSLQAFLSQWLCIEHSKENTSKESGWVWFLSWVWRCALSTNIIVHSNLDLRQNFSFDHSRHPYWFFGEMLNTLNKLCPMHFQACQACLLAPCMVLCQTVPCGSSCSACSAKRTLFNLFYTFYYPKLNPNPQSSNSWNGLIFILFSVFTGSKQTNLAPETKWPSTISHFLHQTVLIKGCLVSSGYLY